MAWQKMGPRSRRCLESLLEWRKQDRMFASKSGHKAPLGAGGWGGGAAEQDVSEG